MDERYGYRHEDDARRFSEPVREYEYEGRPRAYDRRGGSRRYERGFLDRAGDELRSWFGDEEAERRRREDERRAYWAGRASAQAEERQGRFPDDRERRSGYEPDERAWARQWGYVDEPHERRPAIGGRAVDERWSPRGDYPRGDHWIEGGPYAGRGPKGYRRSDERIREDVCDLLCEHGGLDASNVEVQVVAGEVTLIGFIPTRPQKRLAEDLTDSVSGVNEVHNQLRVTQQPSMTQPSAPMSQTTPPIPPPSSDWRNRAA